MRACPSYLDHPGPIPMAHRGFSVEGHENSVEAFQAAVDLGYRYIETDVHATRDDVAIALHDPTLDRVADRTGAVRELAWAEVRRARIGGRGEIPTIEDVLGSWPDLRLNIDIKLASAVAPLVAAIERTGAHDRVCIASFSDVRRRAALRGLSRPAVTSAGGRTAALFVLASATRARAGVRTILRPIDCLQLPVQEAGVPVVSARSVAVAHTAGVPVHVWTVNDSPTMHRLLDLGVDGIITDRADLLRAVLVERGQWA